MMPVCLTILKTDNIMKMQPSCCLPGRATFFAKSQPFASGGAYINFLTQEETDRIEFAYGATYNRLVAPKKKYDPTNLFRMNQNIKPV